MESEQKKITVLLVEDDPGDQKLIKAAIPCQSCEISLSMVSSGEAALSYLEKTREQPRQFLMPNLILLDLNMPGMGGKEFLRRIKANEEFKAIPVVVVTTSDSETDIQECYALHAAGYIQKSAMPDEFSSVLQKLTRYWFSASAIMQH
ncbi:MAG: response regulator [Phycisphaerae bacterium]|jgi:CheY-like chemotaxis protein